MFHKSVWLDWRSFARIATRTVVAVGLPTLIAAAAINPARADALRVGGTGASTEMMRMVGEAFAATPGGSPIHVVPGLGSSGGIAALADGALDIAVSGRDLKPEEAARGFRATVLARSPFGLATSHANPGPLRAAGVAALFSDADPRWPDGAPLRIVLRPKSDADSNLLAKIYPDMETALEAARKRADIPVGATDQDNAALAERTSGSVASMSLTQIVTEGRKLRLIAIDGVEPTLENLESGASRYAKQFYFVFPEKMSPLAERLVTFLRSPDGIAVLRKAAALPPAK